MQHKKHLGLAIVLILTLATPLHAAAPKAGAKCTKAGSTATASGKKFTCIKSGTKLVWNKGVAIKKPAPVVSPTPTPTPTPEPTPFPTPTPTPTPIPTPTPTPTPTRPQLTFIEMLRSPQVDGRYPISYETYEIPTKFPTSWEDLYENRLGIPYKAWLSISDAAKNQKSSLGTIKVTKGPNTTLPFTDIEPALNLVSKAFSNATQPGLVTMIAFNYQDQMWADSVYRNLIANEPDSFKRNHQNYVLEMCSESRKVCWSAMGFTNSGGDGIILLGVVEWEKLRTVNSGYTSFSRSLEGLTIAHEYFHTIQRKIIDKNWFIMEYTPPIWFNEASAVYVENAAMNFNSFDKYMRFRAVDSQLAYPSCGRESDGCIRITEAIMNDFLSLTHYSKNWSNFPYGMKYEVSHRVIEALVSIKGHRSLTDVYAYMAQNHTFEQAFQHIYGISYSSAIPILAKVVSEQFANNL